MPAALSLAARPGHLRVLELCYRYAYLEGRCSLRRPLSADEAAELLLARKIVEGDESGAKRRAHRRFPVLLAATLKTSQGLRSAAVLNVSADGLFVGASSDVELGTTVQVRVDANGVEYVFTCRVVRSVMGKQFWGLGLALCCVPLEMRHRRAA